MKHLVTLCLCLAALVMTSCSDKTVATSEVTTELKGPDGISLQVTSGTYTFTNKTTLATREYAYPLTDLRLEDGLYDLTFKGTGTYSKASAEVIVQGVQENVVVEGGTCNIELKVYVLEEKADFVISELYYIGSAYTDESGTQKQYNGDQYIVLYNNTDRVLYADGLAIAESAFRTTTKYDYTPNLMSTHITVQALFVISGSGTDYPVQPGHSIVLCDNAMNHKDADASFMNLQNANFEWYTESTVAAYPDIDNPDVPNLDLYYCYTNSIFIFNKQGNSGYALIRMQADKEEWLANYTYDAYYINVQGNPTATRTYYSVPNDWVIDAVTVSSTFTDKHQWLVFDQSLDMGYTYCGEAESDAKPYGLSIKRKEAYTNPDGRVVLQDTNNSAEDFLRNQRPSQR